MHKYLFLLVFVWMLNGPLLGQPNTNTYQSLVQNSIPQLIQWRHHFHQFAELSNREFKTAKKIEEILQSFGLTTKRLAGTGVVAVLEGGKPGSVLALRADIDALPVTERNDLAFQSKEIGEYNGEKLGVMHACGHDAHIAMLLGTASVLSKMKNDVPGKVVFIFQPAEEGPPGDEEGGAPLMIKEGVLDHPKVDAIFGIHIQSDLDLGKLYYKTGSFMASSDWFTIDVKGRQTHGANPWQGIDPIVVSSAIVQNIQTIVSRQIDITHAPAIVTFGKMNAGVRPNIISEEAHLAGTIRTLDSKMQEEIHEKIKKMSTQIAAAYGATAQVKIDNKTLVTVNDPKLVEQTIPALIKAAGKGNVLETHWKTGAEDFSFYGQKTPAFFFYLGARDPKFTEKNAPAHHTPDFYINESKLDIGVKAFCQIVFDYAKKSN